MGFGGGNTIGGYDLVGTGAVDDPSRGGRTIQSASLFDSDDDSAVAAIQANVDAQLAQQAAARQQAVQQQAAQQQQALLAEQVADQQALQEAQALGEINRIQRLASRMTPINFARTSGMPPISSLEQLAMRAGQAPRPSSEGLLNNIPSFATTAMSKIGSMSTNKMYSDIMEKGYKPQYDAMGQIVATINPETGQYGSGSVVSRIDPNNPDNTAPPPMDLSDDDGFVAPEATAVAAAQPEAEAEQSMIAQGYRYPAGGIYPTEGQYVRQSLLDVAPTQFGGLLAGYDPAQFGAMNVGFRQPTDVGLYDDPYDVTGYSLI